MTYFLLSRTMIFIHFCLRVVGRWNEHFHKGSSIKDVCKKYLFFLPPSSVRYCPHVAYPFPLRTSFMDYPYVICETRNIYFFYLVKHEPFVSSVQICEE